MQDSFSKAQAALEYLMTYGWAVVLLMTILSVLFFVFASPQSKVVFSSSEPLKIAIKDGVVYDSNIAKILILNASGSKINIMAINPVGFHNCIVNNSSPQVDVVSGGNIEVSCIAPTDRKGILKIEYKDFSGFSKKAIISSNGAQYFPLRGYFKFNGDSIDSSGLGNDCSLENSAQIIGNALYLDGIDSHANCGTGSTLNLQGSLSISAWINPEWYPVGSSSRVVDKGCHGGECSPAQGYSLFVNDRWEWKPHSMGYVVYGGWVEDSTTNSIQLNQWQHVAIVYDAVEQRIKHFLNGAMITDEPYVPPCSSVFCGNPMDSYTRPLTIGIRAAGVDVDSKQAFKGYIDEVKIYSEPLLSGEICNICNEAIPAGGSCSC